MSVIWVRSEVPSKFAGVLIENLYWSVVYCRKCLQYSILPQFIRGYIQVNFDRVYYAYLVDLLVCGTKVVVTWRFVSRETWRRPSLTPGRSDPNAADVVRCLNALTSLDIRNIASDDVLTSLVTDYFVTCQIGKLQHGRWTVNLIRVMMLTIDPPLVDTVGDEVNSEWHWQVGRRWSLWRVNSSFQS